MKKKIINLVFFILLFFSILLLFSIRWVEKTFGLIDLDSLMFHLNVPLKGTESGMVIRFIKDPLFKTLIATTIIFLIMILKKEYRIYINIEIFKKKIKNIDLIHIINKAKFLIPVIIIVCSCTMFIKDFKVKEYIKSQNTYSTFIKENYVEPEKTKITFSEKRNLIHIYAESMESSYSSKEYGGLFEENLIPNLTKYSKNYISFTNNFGGGFYNSRATGWTIAAMVAQTSGIGFIVPGTGNDFGNYSKFLPGAYSLGEILEKEGYNQVLLIGSDGDFAGRNDYFTQHGNYEIKDYGYAKEQGWIPEDYYVWWGYEDSKLFTFAKNELNELSSNDKPFNLTLLTTNTHHIGGYIDENCETKYDEKYKNAIACSDKQIYEFIEWVKQQEFYNNTTIVITGDHLSMDPTFFENVDGSKRTNYNVFINTNKEKKNITNRTFNTMDIYPTIISSIGGNIEGDRLALGTNLFSDKKTLYEEYGKSYVDEELNKNSKYFKEHIIYGNK